ncbi:Ankyrin repeat [Diplonema papillatum]|nr:Ankyrin repeat [Diplonema papillatum]
MRKQLFEAAKRGDEGKVALLLERGCDANAAEPATRETAGHVAARFGRPAALFELFARGADPHARNARGRTPLHDASRTSNPACARLVAAAASHSAWLAGLTAQRERCSNLRFLCMVRTQAIDMHASKFKWFTAAVKALVVNTAAIPAFQSRVLPSHEATIVSSHPDQTRVTTHNHFSQKTPT